MFVNNSAIAVRVVILSVLLLVWLVATLVQRHYDKLRKSAERGSAPVVALPWWVRLGDVSYPVADPATLRAWARESRFGRDDLVWPPGGSRWIAASHVEELRSEFYVSFVSKWKYDLFLKIWPVYLIVVMTAGLVIIAVSFDLGLVSAISSLRWKSTTARIIRSAVSEEDVGPHGYAVIRYRPTIEYEYLVSGKTYVATRRDFERHEDDDRYPDRARGSDHRGLPPQRPRDGIFRTR